MLTAFQLGLMGVVINEFRQLDTPHRYGIARGTWRGQTANNIMDGQPFLLDMGWSSWEGETRLTDEV